MNILIVEDNLLIAEDLRGFLEEFGHQAAGIVVSQQEALAALDQQEVDLVLVDIMIDGEADGIDLAGLLAQRKIPFLYVTSHGDQATVDRAVATQPLGYLLKPFNRGAIYAMLGLAQKQIELARSKRVEHYVVNHYKSKLRIPFSEMLYFKASNNYVELYTTGKKHVFVSSLRKIEEDLPPDRFLRVHKSYLVNFEKIEAFEAARIWLGDQRIPVGKTFLTTLRSRFRRS